MKKRNGFTLIELLAVIVILALISLIAIPMIMNVIESSRKGAYTESLRNLIKAVEYYEAREEIEGNTIDFEEGLSVFDSNIEMKNKNFLSGTIKKNEQGELYLDMVSDGVYCGMGTISKLNVTKGSCGDLDMIVPSDIVITENRVSSNSITIAVSVTTGNSGVKYYEYSMDGGGTYLSSTNDSYTFTGLTKDTDYSIKVRVTGENNLIGESETKIIHTSDVDIPTYVVESAGHWSTSKKVTITYPEVEGYTYEYSLDKGSTWNIAESTNIEIPFSSNGTLVARVTDGNNIVLGESMSVTKITGIELTDYIQDGLQVFYDGKNATGTGPNSNTSSTKGVWKDLSGNGRDGTLVNFAFSGESGWIENGLSFGDELDFVRIAPMDYDEITMEVVANIRKSLGINNRIIGNIYHGGYNLKYLDASYGGTSGNNVLSMNLGRLKEDGTSYQWSTPYISWSNLGTDFYLSGRGDATKTMLNYNDKKVELVATTPMVKQQGNNYMVLGGQSVGDTVTKEQINGNIYVARVYDRALTDDEIEKNYVIDKARYGL